MDARRVEFPRLDKFFDLRDSYVAGSCTEGIKVLGAFFVHEIAVAVTHSGVNEGEIGAYAIFQDVLLAVKNPDFLGGRIESYSAPFAVAPGEAPLRHLSSDSCRCIKRGNTGTPGPQSLRERPLRHELHFELT